MKHFDLIIIGTGSGNSLITPELDDWNVAIVEKGVFGGTCLNRGCIPSKMFVYAADVALQTKQGPNLGVHTSFEGVDWTSIRDRVFDRIDPIAAGGDHYRANECSNVTVYRGHGRFVGPKQLQVGADTISAEQVVIAAGARPFIPPLPGLDTVAYHTSDSIMRVDELPRRLAILGGGYIASELGHVMDAFGVDVTLINRSGMLLRNEDDAISERFTDLMRARMTVVAGTGNVAVTNGPDGSIIVTADQGRAAMTVEADALLVATGRTPNGDQLDLDATGLMLNDAGYIDVDEHGRTAVDGIWALGDVSNPMQLKHVANAEARVVAHNIAHPDDLHAVDLSHTPHAVFGNPQVASVGLTEREAIQQHVPHEAVQHEYAGAAYGWAMEDTTSFCKLLADPASRKLIGAHIIGPQASTMLQQLVQAMRFGQTVHDLARGQIWIHPALPEVVEQTLLKFSDA
ncbi:MAG: mycothione reductase [Acidimicrobiales bacterium]|nr:mycothione reductase [Acidimicrobiales bacterium]